MPRVAEIMARIKARAGAASNNVLAGIGDDGAVLKQTVRSNLIMCSDLSVEGIHFRRDWSDPFSIGHKALAATISDIAAMGGIPRFALVSLALPRETSSDFIDQLIEGLFSVAETYDVAIVGGDTSSSPGPLFIDTILAGECDENSAVLRSRAETEDIIYVTGSLGASAVGLKLLEQERPNHPDHESAAGRRLAEQRASAIKRHILPEPRVKAGAAIGRAGLVSAMIDISDGLSTDLKNLTEASGCGAVLEARTIPIAECAKLLAGELGDLDPLAIALQSGEEYELLFTSSATNRRKIEILFDALEVPISAIGRISQQKGLFLDDGKLIDLPIAGWEHFV